MTYAHINVKRKTTTPKQNFIIMHKNITVLHTNLAYTSLFLFFVKLPQKSLLETGPLPSLPTAALGTVLPEKFFSAKDLCREPRVQTLSKVSAESPRRAVGGKK
jgi:hypothetical protein